VFAGQGQTEITAVGAELDHKERGADQLRRLRLPDRSGVEIEVAS
jgi:hypothetical protein